MTGRSRGPDDESWRSVKPLILVSTATVAAVALAACGSSKSSSTPAVATSAHARTVTVTRTATTPAHAPRPTAAAPCRAAALALSFLGQQGAAGHGVAGFALKNTGAAPCRTSGFPGIQWLDKAGHSLPTSPRHVIGDLAGSTSVASLNVAPGSSVSFRVTVTHGVVPGVPCATAYALQVIPPNDIHTLRVSLPEGVYECRATTVSPVLPGDSAYPG